jgi:hypothetical protein
MQMYNYLIHPSIVRRIMSDFNVIKKEKDMRNIICSVSVFLLLLLTAQGIAENIASDVNKPNVNSPDVNKPDVNDVNSANIKNNELKTIEDCVRFAQKAGNLIQQEKFEEALDFLYNPKNFIRYYMDSTRKTLILTNFRAMFDNAKIEMGKQIPNGFEYNNAFKFSNSEISIYFLSKHENSGIPWKFHFYKPENEWKFVDCGFGPDPVSDLMLLARPIEVNLTAIKK